MKDGDRVSAWALAGAAAPREPGTLAVISQCVRSAPEAKQLRGSGNARRVELGSVLSNLLHGCGKGSLSRGVRSDSK